jgi:hypothetical protein
VAALAVAAFVLSACHAQPPRPIIVEGNRLTLDNRTASEWSNVEIWVNNHYRVTRSTMAAGERLVVPLDAFVAGFGQRFDWRRQMVFGVEVTATAADGKPVRLVYGKGRQR